MTSTEGLGSTFWFTGRFDLSSNAVREPLEHPALRDQRVLVVDDNATQREVLAHQLRGWGMDVLVAATQSAALGALQAAVGEGRPVRLALIDQTLPTDGFTLAHLIKSTEGIAATRLVLLAAPGKRAIAGQTMAAGIATYLRKPIRHGELRQVLVSLVGARGDQVVVAPSVAADNADEAASFEGARVLVAEDNTVNARLATALLERLGCTVDVAQDGVETLEALSRAGYDLVLMDCQMPLVDGFEATRRIRERERTENLGHVPIVAMTANAMAGDRERCLEAGMDDYLAKPVQRGDLVGALRRHLGDEDGPAPVSVAAAGPGTPVGPGPGSGRGLGAARGIGVAPDGPPKVLLDPTTLDQLGALTEAGVGTLVELSTLFAVNTPDLIERIAEGIEAGDPDAFHSAAHTLKGSAAQIGAVRVSAAAAELDRIAKAAVLVADSETELQAQLDRAPTPDEIAEAVTAMGIPITVDDLGPIRRLEGAAVLLADLDAAFGATVAEFRAIVHRLRPGSAPSHPGGPDGSVPSAASIESQHHRLPGNGGPDPKERAVR